jgi:hypothetical protein
MAESEYTAQKLFEHAKTNISEYAKEQKLTDDNLKLALAFLEQYKKKMEEENGTLEEESKKEPNNQVIQRINDTYEKLYRKITDLNKFTKFQNPEDFKTKKDQISITYNAGALGEVILTTETSKPRAVVLPSAPDSGDDDEEEEAIDEDSSGVAAHAFSATPPHPVDDDEEEGEEVVESLTDELDKILFEVLEKIPESDYGDHMFPILWIVKHLKKYKLQNIEGFDKAKNLITEKYLHPHLSTGFGLGTYIYYGTPYKRALTVRQHKSLSINTAQLELWKKYNIETEKTRLLKYVEILLKLVDQNPDTSSTSYLDIVGKNYSNIEDPNVINNMKIVFVLTEIQKNSAFNQIKIPFHYLQRIPKETWEKFLFYPSSAQYSYKDWSYGKYNLQDSITAFISSSDDIFKKLDDLYNLLFPSRGGKRTPKYLPQYMVGSLPKSLKNKIKPNKKSLKRERDIFNLHRIK